MSYPRNFSRPPSRYRPPQYVAIEVRPRNFKKLTGNGERLAAALCHLSILLNINTYVGGLAFAGALCLSSLFLAHRPYLAQQASRALVWQAITWGLLGAVWVTLRLLPAWLGGFFFWPWWALVWFWAIVGAMWKAGRCL